MTREQMKEAADKSWGYSEPTDNQEIEAAELAIRGMTLGDTQAELARTAMSKIREAQQDGARKTVTLFECEASALIAQYNEQLAESISYTETVDSMLDGIIPTRKDPKDPTSQQLWLKERVQLLLDQLEDTADKLSGVWLHLDSWARGEAPSLEFVKDAAASILRHQKAPGWKDADLQRKTEGV